MIRCQLPTILLTLLLTAPIHAQGPAGTAPVDPDPRLKFELGPTLEFGVVVVKDAAGKIVNNRLTYAPNGNTNSTVVRIDGKDMQWGGKDGKILEKETKFAGGVRSVWAVGDVHVHQILEIVPSKQPVEVGPGNFKRLLNTCLVRYELENKGAQPRQVGLRLQIDTLIGSNDGVPFAVPGQAGVVNTQMNFAGNVPDFVQALEKGNLKDPGTVAHLTLKLGGRLEPPGRVSLTRWQGASFKWEVPMADMAGVKGRGDDSAVVLYWNAANLAPGGKRELGFAYGLGGVSSTDQGDLRVTVDGDFVVGKTISVLAYVNKPEQNRQVTLKLPAELERVEGKETQDVTVPKDKGTSLVTWKVKSKKAGKYELQLSTDAGLTQAKVVAFAPAPRLGYQAFGVPTKEYPTIQAAIDAIKKDEGPASIDVWRGHKDPGFMMAGKENVSIYGSGAVAASAAFSKVKNVSMSMLNITGAISITDSVKVTISGSTPNPPLVGMGIFVTRSNLVTISHQNLTQKGGTGIMIDDSFADPKAGFARWRVFRPLDCHPEGGALVAAFGTPAVEINSCRFANLSSPGVAADASHVKVSSCDMSDLKAQGVVMVGGSLGWVSYCNIRNVVDNGILYFRSEGLASACDIRDVTVGLGFGRGIEVRMPATEKGEPLPYTNLYGYGMQPNAQITNCAESGILVTDGILHAALHTRVSNCVFGARVFACRGCISGYYVDNSNLGLGVAFSPGPMHISARAQGNKGLSLGLVDVKDARMYVHVEGSRANAEPAGVSIEASEVVCGASVSPLGGLYVRDVNTDAGVLIGGASKVDGHVQVEHGKGPGVIVSGSKLEGKVVSSYNHGVGVQLYGAETTLRDAQVIRNAEGGVQVGGGKLAWDGGSVNSNGTSDSLRGKTFASPEYHPFGIRGQAGADLKVRGVNLNNFGRAGVWLDGGSKADLTGCSITLHNYRDWGKRELYHKEPCDGLLVEEGSQLTYASGGFHVLGGNSVRVRQGGKATLTDNKPWGMGTDGHFYLVEEGGVLLARNNTVHNHHGDGLHVKAGGKASLVNCDVNIPFADGVLVKNGGEADVQGNTFFFAHRELPLYGRKFTALRKEEGAKTTAKNNRGGGQTKPLEFTTDPGIIKKTSQRKTIPSGRTGFKPVLREGDPAWLFVNADSEEAQPEEKKGEPPLPPQVQKARAQLMKLLDKAPADSPTPKLPKAPVPQRGPVTGPVPAQLPPVASSEKLLEQSGQALVQQNNHEEALAHYQEAVNEHPRNPELRGSLAQVLLKLKQPQEAAEHARAAIELQQKNAGHHHVLGQALVALKKSAEAEKAYREALNLDPTNAAVHADLAVLLLGQDRLNEAAQEAIKARAQGQKAHTVYGALSQRLEVLARGHAKEQRLPQAEAALRQAVGLDPERAELHAALGAILLQSKQPAAAAKAFSAALALDSQNAAAHTGLGDAQRALGNLQDAENAYRAAALLDASAATLERLVHFYLEQKRWSDAETVLRQAAAAEPKNSRHQASLAEVLLQQGRAIEALQAGKQAEKLGFAAAQLPPRLRELVQKGSIEAIPYGGDGAGKEKEPAVAKPRLLDLDKAQMTVSKSDQGKVDFEDGKVILSVPAGQAGAAVAWMKDTVKGDFDLHLDFKLDGWQPRAGQLVFFRLIIARSPRDSFNTLFLIDRSADGLQDRYGCNLYQDRKWGEGRIVLTNHRQGSLRITRRGNELKGWYWDPTRLDWALVGEFSAELPPELSLGINAGNERAGAGSTAVNVSATRLTITGR